MTAVAPRSITFTGVDEHTSISQLKALAKRYPVEFGILISSERGRSSELTDTRYPGRDFIAEIAKQLLPLAAHLCGDDARELVETSKSQWWEAASKSFWRLQVNTRPPSEAELLRAAAFGKQIGAEIIFQTRSVFPAVGTLHNSLAQWLYDCSGGKGHRPSIWPDYRGLRPHGYAGGIAPDNVLDILQEINSAGDYWIDMETGVRTDERFDVDKCAAVCRQVYPDR